MGFFSGRVTFARYKIIGAAPGIYGEEHLARLEMHAAGRQKLASSDGIECGWSAGEHILDTSFELAKNIINDMLHFAMRVDTLRLPSDLLKAYYSVDLKAMAKGNSSGRPSAAQKREARESARDRLEDESKDGRYTKRKAMECAWDSQSNELLFGMTAITQIDRLHSLFQQTFGIGFEAVTAGRRAFQLAELNSRTRAADDAAMSTFVPGFTPTDIAWVLDEASRDFLGNEFLIWLWYTLEVEDDTIVLSDKSEVAIMLARTLTMACPRGVTGQETITSEGPTRLPEAKKAIGSGKLPRKVGVTMVRHDAQYEFTLFAETLAVGSCKMPPIEEADPRAAIDARAQQIRHVIETLDLLYEAFIDVRFGEDWPKQLLAIQKWLQMG